MTKTRTILTGILAAVAITLAGQASAQADESAVESPRIVSVVTHPGTDTDGASTFSSCAIYRYGYLGYRVCEFAYFDRYWSDGNVETFVIGTNYAVYHIWASSGGWKSLGGRARTATPNGAYPSLVYLGVRTIGTDNYWWCRYWTASAWTPWQRCV